jgi:preprotein translocase subunit SecG
VSNSKTEVENLQMLSKAFVVFFLFFLLCVDAKGRGGRAKIRTGIKIISEYKVNLHSISNSGSSSGSSTESSNNSQTGILGTIFFLLSCGCGIFWRLNKCLGKKQHRQEQMHYYIPANPEQIFTLDQRNEKDVNNTPIHFIISV